jgi:serine/threonine protein kinase
MMAERVGQQLGNYCLVRLLGRGDFAEVYLGEHLYLKTQAAIKVLHTPLANDDMEGFLTEARSIARLKHPHIVRVLEFGVEEGIPFLVTTYAPNGSLRQRHPKGTLLALASVVSYVKQAATALQYAHDQKLLHRDIKPENILLGRHNEVLLSDFGMTLMTQSLHYPDAQGVVGSVSYMAPEQLQGKPCPASDQYTLGIVVYEWLSGDCPFHGSLNEIADQHTSTPPAPFREKVPLISPEIEEVVLTALAKDPQNRFSSVMAFAQTLEQTSLVDLPTVALRPAAPSPLMGMKTFETTGTSLDPKRPDLTEHAEEPQPREAQPRLLQRSRSSVAMNTLFILLALLIIGGSGLTYYARVLIPTQLHGQATATAQIAQADATFTSMTPQQIYMYATHGSPVMNDPLNTQNNNTWDKNDSCFFTGGVYHVRSTNSIDCLSQRSSFSNFAFQVQMTILKGDAGGIVFRTYYFVYFTSVGKYTISFDLSSGSQYTAGGSALSFKTGLDQSNLITLVAHSSTFYLYVNKQFVTKFRDSTYSAGFVGVDAQNDTSPSTEVAFSNAQVWKM